MGKLVPGSKFLQELTKEYNSMLKNGIYVKKKTTDLLVGMLPSKFEREYLDHLYRYYLFNEFEKNSYCFESEKANFYILFASGKRKAFFIESGLDNMEGKFLGIGENRHSCTRGVIKLDFLKEGFNWKEKDHQNVVERAGSGLKKGIIVNNDLHIPGGQRIFRPYQTFCHKILCGAVFSEKLAREQIAEEALL